MTLFFRTQPFDDKFSAQSKLRLNRRVDPNAIPSFFVPNIKFLGKWIGKDKICTLLSFDAEKNTAVVDIAGRVEDDWNLQHTIWGFENNDYTLIS